MRIVVLSAVFATGCLLAGCAKRPDAIVPVAIPMAAYTGMDCGALANEYLTEQNTLTAASKQQNDAATGDAVGVFLIGVPIGSTFGGDNEGKVAVSKGKVNAIEMAMRSRGCSAPAVKPMKTAATKYKG